MSTLRFADDIVAKSDIDGIPRKGKVDSKELKLATQIIDVGVGLEADEVQGHLHRGARKRIDRKAKGKDIVDEVEEQEQVDTSNVTDLMEVLQASVEKAKQGRSARKGTTRKRTTQKRKSA